MGAFKAYDIRGVYDLDFNAGDVYRMGFFLPRLLGADRILVGRDARTSSPEIWENLCRGICDAGADVYYIGLATTPMVYFATAHHNFKASVQITASHNPREYNGLKISREHALPVGYDTGLAELERLIAEETPIAVDRPGKVHDFDVRIEYLNFLKKYIPDISDLKVAMDCSNGMACLLIKDLLGDAPEYIYDELDGTFPNHEANPLVMENVRDLIKLVQEKKSDVGVIFDGDADRVMFVDENGRFISPDLMIAVLGHYFLKEPGKKVLQDIRTSKAVGEYLEQFGAEMHMWRVGRAYAALKLREIDGLYGGEFAGHYYFRDFFYSDSGLMACLIALGVFSEMKKQGVTVSELINQISAYASTGEMNFVIHRKQEAMDAIRNYFSEREKVVAFYDFDGYRIEFSDWWFNIRPSNTEPYLRFLAEAKDAEKLKEIVITVEKLLKDFAE